MKKDFWKGTKVLITGYEGFLGSWLTRFLLEAGSDVTGLDILTRRKKTILTADELRRVRIVTATVEDYTFLCRLLQKHRIGFVFHLAAEALVGACLHKPLQAFAVNIGGTWNVLEACRRHPRVQGVIIASSDKAYGSHVRLPYKEDYNLQGDHPYDVSKSCADLLAHTYHHTYGLAVCITRCGNIYGPGDFNFSRIIPDAIRCVVHNKTLRIRSDGKFIRDYVYVKDIALAYILLAEKMRTQKIAGESFNFSDEKPMTVLEVVKAVSAAAGEKAAYTVLSEAQYEIRRQFLSSQKARRILGWKPRYTITQGLKETIDWYREILRRKR